MMKLFAILLILLPAFAVTQPRFSNYSTVDRNTRELYIGVDNRLSIEGINPSAKKRSLTASHGEVHMVDSNRFIIRVTREKIHTLNYYEDGKLVLSGEFSVKQVPPLIARLSNNPDTVLNSGQILANPFLSAMIPGSNYNHEFRILSFTSSNISGNGDTTMTYYQKGYLLSNEQVKEIRTMQPGDRMYFSSIRATCPSCRSIKLPPFTVVIR